MSRHKDFYVELFRVWHQSDKQYGIDQEDIHPGLAIAIVLMEDELVHTDEHPLCDDLECPCHDVEV